MLTRGEARAHLVDCRSGDDRGDWPILPDLAGEAADKAGRQVRRPAEP